MAVWYVKYAKIKNKLQILTTLNELAIFVWMGNRDRPGYPKLYGGRITFTGIKAYISFIIVIACTAGFVMNVHAQYNQYESNSSPILTPPRHSLHRANPQDKAGNESNPIYQKVDREPQYPGGIENLIRFINENLIYPWKARAQKIQGRVFVYFVIRADGSVSGVSIRKGIGGGCDEEAMRVIRMMPDWTPGENEGKKVNVGMIFPVKFTLDTIPEKK